MNARALPLAAALLLSGCVPVHASAPPYAVAGVPVEYRWDATLRGNAASYTDPDTGRCVVLVDPDTWGDLPPVVQHWTLLHELAHCEGAATELDADCAAARRLRAAPADLAALAAHVHDYPASDRHPTGAERAVAILRCAP